MRCTKCSFISFDDLAACAKCASDLSNLSKELNGTCIETRQEFFLGSAVQAGGLDEDNFSDSQALPPIDHSDMNFDDTSTGGFSPVASLASGASAVDFDDSVGVVSEDDVAIELGDIMPIDLDQLDSGSVLSEGSLGVTDALSLDNPDFDLDKTSSVAAPVDKEVDFDLSDGFSDSSSDLKFDDDISDIDIEDSSVAIDFDDTKPSSFDQTLTDTSGSDYADTALELDHDLFEQLSSDDSNLDETTSLDSGFNFNDTQISPFAVRNDEPAPLELDESLVAELAGASSLDLAGEFPVEFTSDSGSGEFELDPALVAELVADDSGTYSSAVGVSSKPLGSVAEEVSLPQSDFFSGSDESSSSVQFEDLTGDFPPIRADEEADLAGLDLSDIDVTDLVDASDVAPASGESLLSSHKAPADADALLALSGENDVFRHNYEDEHAPQAIHDGSSLEVNEVDQIAISGDELLVDNELLSGNDLLSNDISLSLDDTFQEAGGLEGLVTPESDELVSSAGDNALPSLGLLLPDSKDELELSDEIDSLEFDSDFEAFLDKKPLSDDLPQVELISDDEDDGPPELPS